MNCCNVHKDNMKDIVKKKYRRKRKSKGTNIAQPNRLNIKKSGFVTNQRITKRVFFHGKESDAIFRDDSCMPPTAKRRAEQDLKSILSLHSEQNHCNNYNFNGVQKSEDKIRKPCIVKISKQSPSPVFSKKKDSSIINDTVICLSSGSSSRSSYIKTKTCHKPKKECIKDVIKKLHYSLSNKCKSVFEKTNLTKELKNTFKDIKHRYRPLEPASSASSVTSSLRQVRYQTENITATRKPYDNEDASRDEILQDAFVLNIEHPPPKKDALELIFGSPPSVSPIHRQIESCKGKKSEDPSLNRKDTQLNRIRMLQSDLWKVLNIENSTINSSHSPSPYDSQLAFKNSKNVRSNHEDVFSSGNTSSTESDHLRSLQSLHAPSPYKLSYESPSSSWHYSRQRMF